jgi:hypothetical protein
MEVDGGDHTDKYTLKYSVHLKKDGIESMQKTYRKTKQPLLHHLA